MNPDQLKQVTTIQKIIRGYLLRKKLLASMPSYSAFLHRKKNESHSEIYDIEENYFKNKHPSGFEFQESEKKESFLEVEPFEKNVKIIETSTYALSIKQNCSIFQISLHSFILSAESKQVIDLESQLKIGILENKVFSEEIDYQAEFEESSDEGKWDEIQEDQKVLKEFSNSDKVSNESAKLSEKFADNNDQLYDDVRDSDKNSEESYKYDESNQENDDQSLTQSVAEDHEKEAGFEWKEIAGSENKISIFTQNGYNNPILNPNPINSRSFSEGKESTQELELIFTEKALVKPILVINILKANPIPKINKDLLYLNQESPENIHSEASSAAIKVFDYSDRSSINNEIPSNNHSELKKKENQPQVFKTFQDQIHSNSSDLAEQFKTYEKRLKKRNFPKENRQKSKKSLKKIQEAKEKNYNMISGLNTVFKLPVLSPKPKFSTYKDYGFICDKGKSRKPFLQKASKIGILESSSSKDLNSAEKTANKKFRAYGVEWIDKQLIEFFNVKITKDKNSAKKFTISKIKQEKIEALYKRNV